MKKIILILLLITTSCYAVDYGYFCSADDAAKSFSGVLMSTSGTNFLARKIAQREIANALYKETNSKFKVKLHSFWGTNIANGEFNKFSAFSKVYSNKGLYAQNINIETICPYNKISYQNNKLNIDSNMVLKFNAEINQDDLSKMLKRKINIVNNKLNFSYKVSAFGIKTTLNLNADLNVSDNKIQLCDIDFNNNKLINASKYLSMLDLTNFNIDINKNTSADIKIDNVEIKDSLIYLTGYVLIPHD